MSPFVERRAQPNASCSIHDAGKRLLIGALALRAAWLMRELIETAGARRRDGCQSMGRYDSCVAHRGSER